MFWGFLGVFWLVGWLNNLSLLLAGSCPVKPATRAIYKAQGPIPDPKPCSLFASRSEFCVDDKWALLMEVPFVLSSHLGLSGCLCNFLHFVPCLRVIISAVWTLGCSAGCSSPLGLGSPALLLQQWGVQVVLAARMCPLVSCFHRCGGRQCESIFWGLERGFGRDVNHCWNSEAASGREVGGDNPGGSDFNSRSGIRWLSRECH